MEYNYTIYKLKIIVI